MKKQILIICLFFLTALANSASAQEAKRKDMNPEERATKRALMLKQKLNLNDRQVKDLEALFTKQEKDMDAFKDQMKKARETFEKELGTIFTPEQMKQFKEGQAERKEMKADIKEHQKDESKPADSK
ncbi:MAG: hypothetical protein ACKOX3_09940 [Bacteroidota bacterium]